MDIERFIRPFIFRNRFVLEELPEQDIALLRQKAQPEYRKRGETLFSQGGFPAGVYWLQSGKAKIYQGAADGERQTLYIYSDGDLIGHRQLIAGEPHPVTATLLEDSVVRLIPADTFRGLIQSSPFFARNVLTALAREFTVWMNRMNAFTKYPVRHRLALALLILYEQYRSSGTEQGVITITRTELAEVIGATLETVVRMLHTFKDEGWVLISGRSIRLLKPDSLLQLLEKEE